MKKIIRTALFAAAGLLVLHGPALAATGGYYIGADSKQALEQARKADPDNYAVNYFLGQIYLAEGNRDGAIEAWDAYLAAAPDDGRSVAVRERMTLLKLARARQFAEKAAATGGTPPARPPANTIAVTDFKNLGPAKLAPFIKGLTAMIISDLAKVPQVRVLERAKIQALVQEMQLGLASGLIDAKTAPKLGKMVQARKVAWGRMGAPDGTSLKITSIVTEILENTTLKQTDAQGAMAQFFKLQKQLVFGILEGMGIRKEQLPDRIRKAVEKVHTTSIDALVQFGMGVGFLDNKDFAQAKQAFAKAAKIDPQFDLAGEAEVATPVSDVPVTSDGATQEVAMSTAGTGEKDEDETETEETAAGDDETAGDGALATADPSPAETAASDTTTATDTAADTSQTVTTAETGTTLYNGPGHWFVATMLVVSDSHWVEDAFLGDANAPGLSVHTVYSFDSDAFKVNEDTNTMLDVTIGGGSPVPVNQQLTLHRITHDQWIEYGYWTMPSDFTDGSFDYYFTRGWYIDGDTFETPDLTGIVHYNGNARGTFHDGSNAYDMAGTFGCDIDFDAAANQISHFNLSVADGTAAHTASIIGASGNFSGVHDPYFYIINGGSRLLMGSPPVNSSAMGSVFGKSGKYAGGTWSMQNASGAGAAGLFVGTAQ